MSLGDSGGLWAASGVSWTTFGVFGSPLGGLWEPWGAFGVPFGCLWMVFGQLWGAFGGSLEGLRPWRPRGHKVEKPNCILTILGSIFDQFGTII